MHVCSAKKQGKSLTGRGSRLQENGLQVRYDQAQMNASNRAVCEEEGKAHHLSGTGRLSREAGN